MIHRVINILLIILCLMLSGCTTTTKLHEDDDWENTGRMLTWINKHFINVFDNFMPNGRKWPHYLSYRSYGNNDWHKLEYSFIFDNSSEEMFGEEGNMGVTVRQPESESLFSQLIILHDTYPKESIENIKNRIKVKSIDISEQNCPAIRKQYEDFNKMTLSFNNKNGRAVGLFWYHEFIAPIEHGVAEVTIIEDEHSFVKWAKKTEEVLNECIRVGINNGTMKWEQQDLTSK